MVKTCGNCVYMLDDGDGCPFCVWRDLYYFVKPEMLARRLAQQGRQAAGRTGEVSRRCKEKIKRLITGWEGRAS